MVQLKTNLPKFYNDISEVIRAFIGTVDVALVEEFVPDERDICVSLEFSAKDGVWLFDAIVAGNTYEYTLDSKHGSALMEKRYLKRGAKIAVFRAFKKFMPEKRMPWGSLTGIRPTKLYRELGDEADARFKNDFEVTDEKIALAQRICKIQQPIIDACTDRDISVYVGIPFCKTRCLYCSFASEVLSGKSPVAEYLEALEKEIRQSAPIIRERGFTLRSVYIGGGTPTSLSAAQLDKLIGVMGDAFGTFGSEFTVEAGRPDTIDEEKLTVLKKRGVTRISINPQTMNDATLERIGRGHSAQQIDTAFKTARDCGFGLINADIIAGLPGEGEAQMRYTLERIVKLAPENLTVHTLALKRASRLMEHAAQYELPPAEVVERMTAIAGIAADEIGLMPYYMYRQKYMSGNLENVGYARPGMESLYNIDIMEEECSILAFGAGSISKRVWRSESRIERQPNPKNIETYMEKHGTLIKRKTELFN